ncbi:amino acid adenylation domain-containing protein [Streptomyces diacarni]|uniref:amino acid adenylation domain-containing protein n=1 Tax=Streptomyces diacarni TaxID=2800381 RepID=UPI0034068F88
MTHREALTVHLPETWDRHIEACFREQAAARPDALAVVDGQRRLSYAELDARATVVARGLSTLGVRRETLVGMAYERSAEAIVAMLGILLAGGAYVPFNPSYPDRRIEQIAHEAGIGLMLCPHTGRDRISRLLPAEARVLTIEEAARAAEPWATGPVLRVGTGTTADGVFSSPLAYVMFTSGSTGRPKGVMVEHSGVLRLVKDTDCLQLCPDSRVLHSAALEFDASTWEIWGTLLNGGTLFVADRETVLVPWRYGEALREHRVDAAWLTAPLFHQMADEDPDVFAPLTTLLTGGDVVSSGHAQRVLDRHPGLRLLNGYGPTENTTFTTVFPVEGPYDRPLPIGRPIAGTTVLVCDEDGRQVPDGVIGELCTGGVGLARGYLGQPELTRERFVVMAGERFYRTGDRVSRTPDGLLHFHGRLDDQVKISGNLVVVSEVNTALLAVPAIAEAYTRAVERSDGGHRLVSHVVASDVDDAALTAAVAAALPAYMRPAELVRVERLPLNENGKVDWRVLPPAGRTGLDGTPTGTSTELQATLAALWGEVLGMAGDTIAAEDDFFALGGDSLRLGRLMGRIARSLGVRLSLATGFTARTLAAMSEAVQREDAPTYRLLAAGAAGLTDLHPHQRALYAIWHNTPESLAYNVLSRIDVRGPLEPGQLREAVRAVVRRHDALRMRFVVTDGTVRQEPVSDVEPDFVYRENITDSELTAFTRPFHPERPPHLRVLLLRTGPERHALYLDAHHAVFDGESLRILVEEIFDCYEGRQPAGPHLSYAAAAQWCHDRLSTDEGAADEVYWLTQLADAPRSALPTDHPRSDRRAVRGAVVSGVLDQARVEELCRVATAHGTTLYSVLLAGYVTVLSRLTGQDDLVVGSPLSGRIHPDLDAVVGMFVGTMCLRARLGENTTMAGLIGQLDARAREAQQHQAQPFDLLAGRLDAGRDPARNPLFDAFFALQNIDFYEFRKAGLELSLEMLNPGTTRFDLNLQAYLRPDRLVLNLEYAAELFDASSAQYLLDQYLQSLAEITADVQQLVRRRLAGTATVRYPDFDF